MAKLVAEVSRSLAVRVLYFLSFRGLRVDKAKRIADEELAETCGSFSIHVCIVQFNARHNCGLKD